MKNIIYKDGRLFILDQTLLPNTEEYTEMKCLDDCREAIRKLMVRGAPAIGIFAGYAMAVFGKESAGRSKADRSKFKLGHIKNSKRCKKRKGPS